MSEKYARRDDYYGGDLLISRSGDDDGCTIIHRGWGAYSYVAIQLKGKAETEALAAILTGFAAEMDDD